MADNTNQTVVLRVQLSEEDTEKKLGQLAVKLADTRKASTDLTAAYKAGRVSADEFAQQSVQLNSTLRMTQTEQRGLTKTLDAYRAAQNAQAGSYEQAQRQLDVANQQFQKTAGSQDLSTESAKVLSATIAELRGQLTQTDASNQLFTRSVGNYPKGSPGLEQLVQQLVVLQEQQARATAGTKEAETVTRQIGFVQTAAAQAGAQAGLSYEQTTAKVAQYSEALRPAAAALVEVAQAEQQASASGEATGETMQRIGFQTAAARKALTDATAALGKVPEAAEEGEQGLSGFGDSLADLDGKTGAFGGQVANLKQRFTQAKQGIELAKVGFSGLKGAIASTGIGVLVLALGALVQYFVETDAGAEDLSAGLAFLKGLVQPLIGLFTSLGKGAVEAAKNPKQAFQDLVDFIETNVMNRIKAFGVILEAIQTGDFKGLANGVIQLNTGIEDGIGKMQALGQEATRAANAAYAISRAKDVLEDKEIAAIALNEKQKQQAERLVLTAKDRNQTEAQRLANLDKAGKLETEVLNRNLSIERDRYALLLRQNAEKVRTGTLSDEERKAAQEQLAKLSQLQGEYDKQVQVIENRRSVLQASEAEKRKAEAAKAKQEAEKRQEQRLKALREGYALENQLLDGQLRRVQAGSDEELNILQRKLRNGYLSELAQKDLTLKAKRLLEQKYQQDTAKLEQDFTKARILAAYDEEVAALNRRLVLAERGGQQETELKVKSLEKLRDKELASLDQRQDNTQRAALIRANTDRQIQDTRYAAAAAATERFIQGEKNALDEQLAAGTLSQANYDKATLDADIQNAQRRLNVARAFGQQTDALDQKFTEAKIAKTKAVTAADQQEQAKRMELAQALTTSLVGLFQETVAETGATLDDFARKAFLLLVDTVEKAVIAEQIKIIAKAFASEESLATYGVLGFVKSAAIIAAVTVAAEGLKSQLTPPARQFAAGTVLGGPSHSEGGIQLYSRNGYHYGETEGDEVVLTKGVWQNPLLRPLASQLNVLGGGRPLGPSMHMALGGITRPVAQMQLRGAVAPIDYERLAQATARALRQSPPVTRIADVKAGLERDQQTQGLSNS